MEGSTPTPAGERGRGIPQGTIPWYPTDATMSHTSACWFIFFYVFQLSTFNTSTVIVPRRQRAAGTQRNTIPWDIPYIGYSIFHNTLGMGYAISHGTIFLPSTINTSNRVFTIYQTMLGWKTYKYFFYETDDLPQPSANPTQQKWGLKWHLGHFFPRQIVFRGLGLVLYRKQTTRNLTQPNSPQTPSCIVS